MKLKYHVLIGTLYCAKGNYEFGISRVIKSLEPYNKKLGTDTWFYAKRCFLSLIENLAKHMISVRDSVIQVTYIEKQRKCIKSRLYIYTYCISYLLIIILGVYSISGALWDLREERQNRDWAAIGRNTTAQRKKYSYLRSQTSESIIITTWNGINASIKVL